MLERQRRRLVIPFLLPALLIYSTLMLYPAFTTFVVAFTDWDGVKVPAFLGFDNFQRLAQDDLFRDTISHTIWFTVLGAFMLFPFAIFFGYRHERLRFARGYRFFILAPVALSVTTAALMWKFLIDPNFGAIPRFFGAVGLDGVAKQEWLGEPSTAMLLVVIATIWHGIGLWMMFFVAAFEPRSDGG